MASIGGATTLQSSVMADSPFNSTDITRRTVAELILGTLTYVVIIAMTVGGNILVVISVFNYRPLRKVQNYFLVSLAAADLAVAILVMPLHVVKFLAGGRWLLGSVICQMFTTLDILCCTASILNLCAIALDRYWAIHNPIEYAQKRTLRLVCGLIVLVWLASALISIPPLIGWNDWTDTGKLKERCELTTEKAFVLFSASGSFFIPLAIMTSVYVKIFMAARQRIRTNRGRSALGRMGNSERTITNATDHVMVTESAMTASPITVDGCALIDGAAPTTAVAESTGAQQRTERTPLVNARMAKANKSSPSPVIEKAPATEERSSGVRLSEDDDEYSSSGDPRKTSRPGINRFLKPHVAFSAIFNGKIFERAGHKHSQQRSLSAHSPGIGKKSRSVVSKGSGASSARSASEALQTLHLKEEPLQDTTTSLLKRREKISVAKEKKAAKTLAVIMGVFVLCWLPFFLMYVIMPFCDSCSLHPKVVEAITWLGYINSAINPVIYTIFNLDFRRAFEKFLCPKSVRRKRRFSNARGDQ